MSHKVDFRRVEGIKMLAKGWKVLVKEGDEIKEVGPYDTIQEAIKVHGEQIVRAYFGR